MKRLTVKAGKHHFKPSKMVLHARVNKVLHLNARFTFEESCRYYLEYSDSLQINKLYGICKWYHHLDSCRIGYIYNVLTDKMDLYVYPYYQGNRLLGKYLDPVTSVPIAKEFYINYEVLPDKYIVYVNLRKVGETPSSYGTYIGYELEPYFGGKITATHNMDITVRK